MIRQTGFVCTMAHLESVQECVEWSTEKDTDDTMMQI